MEEVAKAFQDIVEELGKPLLTQFEQRQAEAGGANPNSPGGPADAGVSDTGPRVSVSHDIPRVKISLLLSKNRLVLKELTRRFKVDIRLPKKLKPTQSPSARGAPASPSQEGRPAAADDEDDDEDTAAPSGRRRRTAEDGEDDEEEDDEEEDDEEEDGEDCEDGEDADSADNADDAPAAAAGAPEDAEEAEEAEEAPAAEGTDGATALDTPAALVPAAAETVTTAEGGDDEDDASERESPIAATEGQLAEAVDALTIDVAAEGLALAMATLTISGTEERVQDCVAAVDAVMAGAKIEDVFPGRFGTLSPPFV